MATLTLKNVPDELYERLKAQAAAHRRSLNQEAIEILANGWLRISTPDEQAAAIARIEALHERQRLAGVWMDHERLKELIEEERR